jgi:hypothetical protein
MANRMWQPHQGSLDVGVVAVQGSFAPNGGSAVSAASNKGKGWSVAHTSTGLFTITLEDVYPAMLSATATLQLATAADQFVQIGAIDLSAKTVQIRVWDVSAAAVADVAADANNRINFRLIFRNSSVA